MTNTNIVTAPIGANRMTKTRPLYQYDYGQVLVLTGIELPTAYEVHFSNSEFGESKVQIGNSDGVTIPDEYLESGADIYAWLYLHTGADDGETVYKILIPVEKRASISPEEPTPVQQDAITQAIAALNDAVDRTAQDVEDADSLVQAAQQSAEDAQQSAREAASAATGSVHFDVEQTLTAEEKARARENIGAASGSDIPTGTVRYDEAQTLTEEQKEQARDNIDAASVEQFDAEVDDLQAILKATNSVKLCDSMSPGNNTHMGVTFTWTGNSKCLVTGTPTGNATSFSFARADFLPNAEFEAGGTYFLHLKASSKVQVRIVFTKRSGGAYMTDTQYYTADTLFTIPSGYNAFSAVLYVPSTSGYVYETVECGVYTAPSNLNLWNDVDTLLKAKIPKGGSAGQVLTKASGFDYDTEWKTPEDGGVTDVRVNGTSVVTDGVANVPVASNNTFGVVKIGSGLVMSSGAVGIQPASSSFIKTNATIAHPIVPFRQHESVFYGLAKAAGDTTQSASSNAVGSYTDEAKSAISTMLSAPVSVTGTTPTITALSGIQYVCGEVTTLDITLPASGIVDVVFESGSTPTVLTITPPTGVTVKWANGFDPTNLEANTTYELNIKDGLGVAGAWS